MQGVQRVRPQLYIEVTIGDRINWQAALQKTLSPSAVCEHITCFIKEGIASNTLQVLRVDVGTLPEVDAPTVRPINSTATVCACALILAVITALRWNPRKHCTLGRMGCTMGFQLRSNHWENLAKVTFTFVH